MEKNDLNASFQEFYLIYQENMLHLSSPLKKCLKKILEKINDLEERGKDYFIFLFIYAISYFFPQKNFVLEKMGKTDVFSVKSENLPSWNNFQLTLNFFKKTLIISKNETSKVTLDLKSAALRWIGNFEKKENVFAIYLLRGEAKKNPILFFGGNGKEWFEILGLISNSNQDIINELFRFIENREWEGRLSLPIRFTEKRIWEGRLSGSTSKERKNFIFVNDQENNRKGIKKSNSYNLINFKIEKTENSLEKKEKDVLYDAETKKEELRLAENKSPFSAEEIQRFSDFHLIYSEKNCHVYENISNQKKLKLFSTFNCSIAFLLNFLTNVSEIKNWSCLHEEIKVLNNIDFGEKIIFFQKMKKYGFFYKNREFIFARTVFKNEKEAFILDKSVPFHYTEGGIRGEIEMMVYLQAREEGMGTDVIVSIEAENKGYITKSQNHLMNMSYLLQFERLKEVIGSGDYLKESTNFNLGTHEANTTKLQNIDFSNKENKETEKNETNSKNSHKNINILDKTYCFIDLIDPSHLLDLIHSKTHHHLALSTKFDRIIDYEVPLILHSTCLKEGHYALKNDWTVSPHGGLLFINKNILKVQKGMLSYLIKRLGSTVIQGKPISSISFPIELYNTYTDVEKFAFNFGFLPHFIKKAAGLNEPLEQLKLCITFVVTTFHMGAAQTKPMESQLGETFQGRIGNILIYFEHINREHPTTSFLIISPLFKVWGYYLIDAHLNANSVFCVNKGKIYFSFKSTNEIFEFSLPEVSIKGTAFGERILNHEGKMIGKGGDLYAEINFNPDKKEGLSKIFGPKGRNADVFEGTIYKQKELLTKIEGIWHQKILFDGQAYWELGKLDAYKVEYQKNPLPSDSIYREDVNLWKKGESVKAQESMERIKREEVEDDKKRKKRKRKEKK